MLRHMVCTPFWLVLKVYQAVVSYQKFSCPCSLKVHAEEDADFSKLPFMLKSLPDHLNSIRESVTNWCTETAISHLEIEHGITIKGCRGPTVRKSPPLSDQQF